MISIFIISLGAIFVALGILGFFQNPVFDTFSVGFFHNILHIISGIFLIITTYQSTKLGLRASLFLGITYAFLAIIGITNIGIEKDNITYLYGFMRINGSDNILHLLFAIILISISVIFFNKNLQNKSNSEI